MKKLSLLLVVLLTISVFLVGCGKDAADTESTASNETISFLDDEGNAKYRIVRPNSNAQETLPIATRIFKALKGSNGASFKNFTDVEEDDGAYEILIGKTNRPETAEARQYIVENCGGRYNDYVIMSIGNKIVIYGMTDASLEKAAQYFIDNYANQQTIDGGILYVQKTEGDFMNITINGVSIANFSVIRPRYNTSYLTYLEVEKMVDTVKQSTGVQMDINDDKVTAEAEYEIIVGNVERPGVTVLEDRDDYEVKVSGKKVYINGGSHYATTVAVVEFAKKLVSGTVSDADSFHGSYVETVEDYDEATFYKPVFYDDFDGDALDTSKWQLRGGNGHSSYSSAGVNGSRCDRSTDPTRVFVKDGLFQIHPYYDEENNVYYGGFIETKDTMKLTYGCLEMSARLPDGDGFWTSLWLRCGDYSGAARPEIDVNEAYGNAAVIQANMHTWPGNDAELYGVEHTALSSKLYPKTKYYCPDNKLFSDDFHTFGMVWTDETVTFTCDGKAYFVYNMGDKPTDHQCFSKLMHIVISEAVGFEKSSLSIENATPEEWENTSQMYVDWFYVYQIKDGKQVMEFY